MIFDDETEYWQKEYKDGNLDEEDICGTARALLDGSAVQMIIPALIFSLVIVIVCYYFFG